MAILKHLFIVSAVLFLFPAAAFCGSSDTIGFSLDNAIYSDDNKIAEVVIPNLFCASWLYSMTLETEVHSQEGTTILRGVIDSTFQIFGQSDGAKQETHIKVRLSELMARYYARHTLQRPITEIDVNIIIRNGTNWRLVTK